MTEHKIQDGLFYNKDHEWVKIDGDTAVVGISDHAQNLLTDIVFVELPAVGKVVKQFETACVVESVKSVSDVYSPLGGTIFEVNMELESSPQLVNSDPYGAGWMYKLNGFNAEETKNLMEPGKYREFLDKEEHK